MIVCVATRAVILGDGANQMASVRHQIPIVLDSLRFVSALRAMTTP
jgi:hypothetical protein